MTIIAVDVPSGLMGDTGANAGAVHCTLTVTCFRKRPGHLLQPGRSLCGELVVADIGTPASVFEKIRADSFENDPALWAEAFPALSLDGNKFSRGHALAWGGWPTTGAARMAARAAARVVTPSSPHPMGGQSSTPMRHRLWPRLALETSCPAWSWACLRRAWSHFSLPLRPCGCTVRLRLISAQDCLPRICLIGCPRSFVA
jgi:hypothetical protein